MFIYWLTGDLIMKTRNFRWTMNNKWRFVFLNNSAWIRLYVLLLHCYFFTKKNLATLLFIHCGPYVPAGVTNGFPRDMGFYLFWGTCLLKIIAICVSAKASHPQDTVLYLAAFYNVCSMLHIRLCWTHYWLVFYPKYRVLTKQKIGPIFFSKKNIYPKWSISTMRALIEVLSQKLGFTLCIIHSLKTKIVCLTFGEKCAM